MYDTNSLIGSFMEPRKWKSAQKLVPKFSPSYSDKQPYFTGGPTFYWGLPPPRWLRKIGTPKTPDFQTENSVCIPSYWRQLISNLLILAFTIEVQFQRYLHFTTFRTMHLVDAFRTSWLNTLVASKKEFLALVLARIVRSYKHLKIIHGRSRSTDEQNK